MHGAAALSAPRGGVPARIGFEIAERLGNRFHPEKIRGMCGARPHPRHPAGELYLNGRWILAGGTVQ